MQARPGRSGILTDAQRLTITNRVQNWPANHIAPNKATAARENAQPRSVVVPLRLSFARLGLMSEAGAANKG